jgi:glycosyltransferase involved in cell wall biosynthesis
MRILMCNSFYYIRGGVERCFFDLMNLLSARGHESIPFCMRHERNLPTPYEPYFVDAIDYPAMLGQQISLGTKLKLAKRVLYFKEAQRQIDRMIQDTKPDIAHIQQIDHEISPSILPIIKQYGIPIVQTLHDYKLVCPNTNFYTHGEICERCAGINFYHAVLRKCKRGALMPSLLASVEAYYQKLSGIYEKNVDRFIAPSKFLLNKLTEHGFKGCMLHLPHFVDLDLFAPGDEKADYFVYFGRLVALKGVHTLLKAMQLVKTDKILFIVGEGELETRLRDFIKENRLTNIRFKGYMSTQDLIPFVQRAIFTVFPSECYENHPMAVVESLACATPVVGSDLGGISELIEHGHTGLLFDPGNHRNLADQLQWMLSHPEKTRQMGINGRKEVESVHHPQVYYEKIMQLYQNLLSKGKGNSVR